MKPGPRPVPTHLRVLRGNPDHRPIRNEPQPLIPDDCPEPPPFLSAYANDEWWRIGDELHRLGLLTKVDIPALAAYCDAFGQWRMAAESLAKMQANDPIMNGMIIKPNTTAGVNPLVSSCASIAADVVRYAAEFGLTPAARSRITPACIGDNSQSKFAGLLAG